MEEKIDKVMKFYLMATKLKYKIRSGWNEFNWRVKGRLESIAEHVYGVCILALTLDSEFELNIDFNKVLKMLIMHEIGEVIIGDITPYDGISLEEKNIIEHKAWEELLDGLIKKEEYYSLLMEFDEGKTNEARFAYLCDKIEADIQSKVYQDKNCHLTFEEQKDNEFFKNEKLINIINNGAKTAFDVWYEADKDKFEENEIFKEILNYIKENDIDI